MTSIYIFVFLFGTAVGSFLNVVIYRYNTGRSMVNDRSVCFSCGKQLAWYELIPVLSYVIQRGRCRTCGARISPQYALVELMAGIVFVWIAYIYPFIDLVTLEYSLPLLLHAMYIAAIWSILIVILVYDLRHKIIPDELVYLFASLSFAKLFLSVSFIGVAFRLPSTTELLAGIILFVPFYALWKVSKGAWIGLGDGKLALGIGWFLGLIEGTTAIMLAFWMGAAVGIGLIVLKKIMKRAVFHRIALYLSLNERIMKSEIPFAPFLIVGIGLVFFFGINITDLVSAIGLP